VLELRVTLLALYLRRGDRKTDVRQFVLPHARPRRDLAKTHRGDGDTDAIEAPTQSSRLPPGQRSVVEQNGM
jgi:hypothetical protein